jgi:hypothetical protein
MRAPKPTSADLRARSSTSWMFTGGGRAGAGCRTVRPVPAASRCGAFPRRSGRSARGPRAQVHRQQLRRPGNAGQRVLDLVRQHLGHADGRFRRRLHPCPGPAGRQSRAGSISSITYRARRASGPPDMLHCTGGRSPVVTSTSLMNSGAWLARARASAPRPWARRWPARSRPAAPSGCGRGVQENSAAGLTSSIRLSGSIRRQAWAGWPR